MIFVLNIAGQVFSMRKRKIKRKDSALNPKSRERLTEKKFEVDYGDVVSFKIPVHLANILFFGSTHSHLKTEIICCTFDVS